MRRMHDAGAVSPETALTLSEIGQRDSFVFRYLASRGVIVAAGVDRYYIDPVAEQDFRRRRFRFTITVLAVGIGILILVWMMILAR